MHQSKNGSARRVMALVTILIGLLIAQTSAAETIKVVTGHGVWDTFPTEFGVRNGIFKQRNVSVDYLYSAGTGETMQAVISGSADIGEVGTLGTLAAYLKGAPIRIIGAEATGSAEFWYAREDSGIRTLKEAGGKTIAFSSSGSSTNSVVRAFLKEYNINARPIATGSPAATLTAVMTKQVDIGWSSPPFGLQQIDEGSIRIVARGNDAPSVRGQTIRVIIANANSLKTKRDLIQRYMDGRREAVDRMYEENSPALKYFAEANKITEATARRMRDFYPKEMLLPDPIRGLDELLAEAVALKYIPQPLTKAQLDEVIQLVPPRR
jgi:NitT/TauT family transport system substrate-binding protein